MDCSFLDLALSSRRLACSALIRVCFSVFLRSSSLRCSGVSFLRRFLRLSSSSSSVQASLCSLVPDSLRFVSASSQAATDLTERPDLTCSIASPKSSNAFGSGTCQPTPSSSTSLSKPKGSLPLALYFSDLR